MNKIFTKISLIIIALTLFITLALGVGIVASAEENDQPTASSETRIGGEEEIADVDFSSEGGEAIAESEADKGGSGENVFQQIYDEAKINADKIFAFLAFFGTLAVGIGYKSGLLPLLRDALTRLKSSIDGVKADTDLANEIIEQNLKDLSLSVDEIGQEISSNSLELSRIKLEMRELENIKCEREAMRVILSSQIDMLYAIFMSSALPQYQKDEIGEHIGRMKEELKYYEQGTEE